MKSTMYGFAALALLGIACGDDGGENVVSTTPESDAGSGGAGGAARAVTRTDIVSDQSGAAVQDPNLVNAWGLAFNPAGAAWVSAAETGVSTVYGADGTQPIPPVAIAANGQTGSPTGQVFNGDAEAFEGDRFIFATEQGTISGWQPSNGEAAVQRVDNSSSDASYKGIETVTTDSGTLLFAADFHNGKIDAFDTSYQPVDVGDFSDPDLPTGFAPFNVEAYNDRLIVTYALQDQDKEDDVRGVGNGYVNLFESDGTLVKRLVSAGELNSPWGVAVAPEEFAAAPNRMLIGNFGDGRVHVYTLDTSAPDDPNLTLEGALTDTSGDDLVIDGLWALEFGVDAGGFDPDTLYFTAGPDDESHGVFGLLQSVVTGTGAASDGGTTTGGGSSTDGGTTTGGGGY